MGNLDLPAHLGLPVENGDARKGKWDGEQKGVIQGE